jgi:amidase
MSTSWDLLTADVKYLQELLSNGVVNSTDLVEKYVAQIKKYDHYLHAVISVTPQDSLDKAARGLDEERKAGRIRGPLHGIPIIIKVTELNVDCHKRVTDFTGQHRDSGPLLEIGRV